MPELKHEILRKTYYFQIKLKSNFVFIIVSILTPFTTVLMCCCKILKHFEYKIFFTLFIYCTHSNCTDRCSLESIHCVYYHTILSVENEIFFLKQFDVNKKIDV